MQIRIPDNMNLTIALAIEKGYPMVEVAGGWLITFPDPMLPSGVVGPQGVQGIVGPQGIQGATGAKGDTGAQGIQGVAGTRGLTGFQGETGDTGIQGVTGTTGSQGIQGTQGIQGAPGITDTAIMTRTAMTNRIANGNFVNTTGWTPAYCTAAAASNILSLTGNGTLSTFYETTDGGAATIGRKYYLRIRARVRDAVCASIRTNVGGALTVLKYTPTIDTWYNLSVVITASSTSANIVFQVYYADAATANGKILEIQYGLCLDLTTIFGAGSEPTAAVMDAWLLHYDPTHSWFTGTVNVPTMYRDGILTHDDWETFNNKAPTGLAGTKIYYTSDTSGGTVNRKLTFTNGVLTSET